MSMLEQISNVCYLITAFSGFMLGALFLTQKIKRYKANIFLVVFVWSLCYSLINEILTYEEVIRTIGSHSLVFDTSLFIVPSLFLYIIYVIYQGKSKKLKYWMLLYVPGIVMNILFYDFNDRELVAILYGLLYFFLSIPLFILSMHYLRKYKRGLEYYHCIGSKTISWISILMIVVIGLHILMLTIDVFTNEKIIDAVTDFIGSLVTFFIVYWIGVKGFKEYESKQTFLKEKSIIPIHKRLKGIKEEDKIVQVENREKFEYLCNIIKQEKFYKNPDLTIKSLSELLKVKERELSNLINNRTKNNFHQFINQFRVLEFKELIESDKAMQYSILGLAKDAGFSSKSTFYKVFKEFEGITPSEYKSQLKSPKTCSRTG